MKWFFIYMVSLYALWHAIDIEADSVLESAIAPIVFAVILVAFLIWLSPKLSGRSSSLNGGAGGVGSSWGSGGDGGGGGGAC